MLSSIIFKYKLIKQSIISINWKIAWEEEEIYLNELQEEREKYPSSSIYDSLFQYKAQVYGVNKKDLLLMNFLCAFGMLFILMKAYFKKNILHNLNYDVAYFYKKNIFNEELYASKKLILIENDKLYLSKNDVLFILQILLKFKFNFIILSAATFRIAQISYAINRFSVREVWSNMEYSCASGIVKEYCHQHKLIFNNFMHGEKVLSLRDCFSSFDNFHVWDVHYMNLFRIMQTNSKIVISNPFENYTVDRSNITKNSICYFFKGIESIEEINKIKNIFKMLKEKGFDIYLKDHPRNNTISINFEEYKVLNKDLDFFDLVKDIDYIVAQYSTVLTQCEYLGINYFIDDLSDEKQFSRLKDRVYIHSNSNKRLSNIIYG